MSANNYILIVEVDIRSGEQLGKISWHKTIKEAILKAQREPNVEYGLYFIFNKEKK